MTTGLPNLLHWNRHNEIFYRVYDKKGNIILPVAANRYASIHWASIASIIHLYSVDIHRQNYDNVKVTAVRVVSVFSNFHVAFWFWHANCTFRIIFKRKFKQKIKVILRYIIRTDSWTYIDLLPHKNEFDSLIHDIGN